MTKLTAITTVAMLTFTATGHAFTRPAAMPINQYTNLECVQTVEQPRTAAGRNPIYKIMVNLTLDENGNDVVALNATHVAADGTKYDRDDQYSHANVWQKKGFTEWYWNGTSNRNASLKMGGRLYRTSGGTWVYEETLLKNGQPIYFMASRCHVELEPAE
jgi:hypothetical protein